MPDKYPVGVPFLVFLYRKVEAIPQQNALVYDVLLVTFELHHFFFIGIKVFLHKQRLPEEIFERESPIQDF